MKTPSAAAPKSDESLEREIRRRFAASKISSNGFQVSVQDGVVTLTGNASVAQHKGVATRLARAAGAREVRNQIEIGAQAKAKLSESLSRGRRQATPDAPPRPPPAPPTAAAATQSPEVVEAKPEVKRFQVLPPSSRGKARSERNRRY